MTKRYDDPHMAQKAAIEALIDEQVQAPLVGTQGPPPTQEPTPPRVDPPSSDTASITATLLTEIEKLRQELQAVKVQAANRPSSDGDINAGPAGWPWAYYKRAPRGMMAGWITYAPGGRGESGRDMGAVLQYQRKGFRLLDEYGVAPIPSDVKYPGQEFVPLLNAGGAKEFPVAQILQYKWHINPPIRGLTFPQVVEALERGDVVHFDCPDCIYEVWCLRGDKEVEGYVFRHLRSKVVPDDGRHGYPRQEAVDMMKLVGFADPRPYFPENLPTPPGAPPPRLAPSEALA